MNFSFIHFSFAFEPTQWIKRLSLYSASPHNGLCVVYVAYRLKFMNFIFIHFNLPAFQNQWVTGLQLFFLEDRLPFKIIKIDFHSL